jgi:hypothetical protein
MTGTAVALTLSISVGKTDRILLAPAFLCARLHKIIAHRRKMKMDNIYPSISEIKTTHFICFDVSFKPCVITAHEYVRQSAKNVNLGGEIGFELRFNSDYLNDTFFEFEMPQISCSLASLPDIIVQPFDQAVYIANGNLPTNFGQGRLAVPGETANFIDGFNYQIVAGLPVDTTVTYGGSAYDLNVAAAAGTVGAISYIYTDANGVFIAGPDGSAVAPDVNGFGAGGAAAKVQRANYVRACELVGARLTQRVSFEVDNNAVADYHYSAILNYRERFISASDCRNAYDLLIGQEVAYDYVKEKSITHQTNVPGLAADLAYIESHREVTKVANGLQTAKPVIPVHTLICPALFWFSVKRKDSIPVLCLPDADVRFHINTARLTDLYYPEAGDTYIQETVTLLNAGVNSIVNQNVLSQRRVPFLIPNSIVSTDGTPNAYLNTCQIYLDDCVHTVILNRIGFHLIRILRHNVATLDQEEKDYEINGIKWPVEYIFVRDVPRANTLGNFAADNWWRCGHQIITPEQGNWCSTSFPVTTVTGGVATTTYTREVSQCHPAYLRTVQPAITSFGVQIYDTTFFEKRDSEFYRQYIPYAYCNGYIMSNDSPQFQQNLIFNFAQIPGYSNPNGHFNISKTRNINYNISADLGSLGKVDCITDAHCLNFIVISDGSLALRYI